MRVVDTSLWIELVSRGPLLAIAKEAVTPHATCIVPAMVHYELLKWCSRILPTEDTNKVMSLLTECSTADMDAIVAAEAAHMSLQHKLHATDAIIYATARLRGAPLLTCDAHFKDLPGVEYSEKKSAPLTTENR